MRANQQEMSQLDAQFLAEEHGADLVALVACEKEPLSRLLEKYLYVLFMEKARITPLTLSCANS